MFPNKTCKSFSPRLIVEPKLEGDGARAESVDEVEVQVSGILQRKLEDLAAFALNFDLLKNEKKKPQNEIECLDSSRSYLNYKTAKVK